MLSYTKVNSWKIFSKFIIVVKNMLDYEQVGLIYLHKYKTKTQGVALQYSLYLL